MLDMLLVLHGLDSLRDLADIGLEVGTNSTPHLIVLSGSNSAGMAEATPHSSPLEQVVGRPRLDGVRRRVEFGVDLAV